MAVRDELLRIIQDDARVGNVVNFGSAHGWLEHEVASKVPRLRVWGLDRSKRTMNLNRREFRSGNCSFGAGDIHEFIEGNHSALEKSIFCHVNVGVYFLPEFMKQSYHAVFRAGALYVVLFEPSGLSRQTGDFYRYSMEVRDSVVFRGPMILHNYPNLLRKSGYEVIKASLHAPPHPHKDFRSVEFTARRKS